MLAVVRRIAALAMSATALALTTPLALASVDPGPTPAAWSAAKDPYRTLDGSFSFYATDPGASAETGVDPLVDDAVAAFIDSATTTLDLALYDFNRDIIIDAVLAAADRGVQVRFVGDADESADLGYQTLLAYGIPMSLRPPSSTIMHDKFIVVDGVAVCSGSLNMSDNGVMRNDNHTAIYLSPELAAQYTAEFEQMFTDAKFGRRKVALPSTVEPLGDAASVQVTFSPKTDNSVVLRDALATANHSIWFMIFSFTRQDVADDLVALHAAGVEVVGVFDKLNSSQSYSRDGFLAANGIPVLKDGNENQGGKLHHKVAIVDAGTDSDPLVISGSYNWSAGATNDNDENVLVLRGAEVVEPFVAEFCRVLELGVPRPDAPAAPDVCARRQLIRVNEVMPAPASGVAGDAYVELVNAGAVAVDLAGWRLGDADEPTRHTFASSLVLEPGAAVVIWSGTSAATPTRFTSTGGAFSLPTAGGDVFLVSPAGAVVDHVAYQAAAPGDAFNRVDDGGEGPDFALHSALSPTGAGSSPGHRVDGGAWTAVPEAEPPAAPAPTVIINELLPNPDGTDLGQEYVELVNTGDSDADLSGWTLGDAMDPARHVFAAGTILPAGGALVVYDRGEHPGALLASTAMLSLNNTGETVTLTRADGVVADVVSYESSASGVAKNRAVDADPASPLVDHTAAADAVGAMSPGLRADQTPWLAAELLITELLANPVGTDLGQEYVVIENVGNAPADLAGVAVGDLQNLERHVFAAGATLAPGARVVIFDRGEHGDVADAIVSSTGTLSLNNTGDTITLTGADGVALDVVTYGAMGDGEIWTR
ncbi:MAG: lamin tail domain-containing protein [Deltaproteobacteria bacterium]|nr:lamin tail domain-containing protein [Deltaproteobacteria bacterium]